MLRKLAVDTDLEMLFLKFLHSPWFLYYLRILYSLRFLLSTAPCSVGFVMSLACLNLSVALENNLDQ
jgi:hypothetical protein